MPYAYALRLYSVPGAQPLDKVGFSVFEDEHEGETRIPMAISLYKLLKGLLAVMSARFTIIPWNSWGWSDRSSFPSVENKPQNMYFETL